MSIEDYLAFFETMTPERLDALDGLTTEDVRFRDPFNDVSGRTALRRIFEEMFVALDAPRFSVLAHATDGHRHFVRWHFTARGRTTRASDIMIEGMSEITLDAGGRVACHVDFWDPASALYERIPVLGWLLRRLRRRLAVREPPPGPPVP